MICHSVSHLLVSSFTVNSLSSPSASNLPSVPLCVPLYHHCVQHVTTLCARIVSQLRPTNNQGSVMTSIGYHALGVSPTSLLFSTFLNKYPIVIKQNQEVMRLTWRVGHSFPFYERCWRAEHIHFRPLLFNLQCFHLICVTSMSYNAMFSTLYASSWLMPLTRGQARNRFGIKINSQQSLLSGTFKGKKERLHRSMFLIR